MPPDRDASHPRTTQPPQINAQTLGDMAAVPDGANGTTATAPSSRTGEILTDSMPVGSPIQELDSPPLFAPARQIRNTEATIDSLRSMSIDDAPTRSRNPSYAAPTGLHLANESSSMSSNRHRMSIDQMGRRNTDPEFRVGTTNGSLDGFKMSSALPEDDGMRELRAKMQQIHRMAASAEEKAKRMHSLMTAEYDAFRAKSQRALDIGGSQGGTQLRSLSPASVGSGYDPENPYNIQPGDKDPTFAPPDSQEDDPSGDTLDEHIIRESTEDDEEDAPDLGCAHYKRNVKVQCSTCRRWYTCRFCHDEEITDHQLERSKIRNMLCMICSTPQRADEYCRQCESQTACYFCSTCKLWDNDASHNIYHCDDCGICRRGRGLGKDYMHCKKCNVCISIAWIAKHRCIEGATERDCPICGDYMFSSSSTVVAMRCGHYIHRSCYDAHMQSSYKCPICNHSAVNMELQWRKVDRAIEEQPMPEQYRNTRVHISCNDCSVKTIVPFHWLGNKCGGCDSYNTQEIKLIDGPGEENRDEATETRMANQAEQILVRPPNAPSPAPVLPDREGPALAFTAHVPSETRPLTSPGRSINFAPHSPSTNGTLDVDSPRSQVFSASSVNRSRQSSADDLEMTDADTPSGYTTDDDNDNMAFWGDGISPSGWLPNPRSWNTPSFLSDRLIAETHQDAGPSMLERGRGLLPGGGWTGPRDFLAAHLTARRNSVPSGDARRPNSWGPSGWTFPSAQWANQRFFGSGNQAATVEEGQDETTAAAEEGTASGQGWRIPSIPAGGWASPRFLAQRLGRGGVPDSAIDVDEEDEDEESEDESDSEDNDDDRLHGDESDQDIEDDIVLFGHR